MKRDWQDFKSLHSNIAGARQGFEYACEILYRSVYSGRNVQQVEVSQGDGGIDIYVGELGLNPIIVIQCKFFLEKFGDAQKAQIRKSFQTAIDSTHFVLSQWILCIPRVLDLEHSKWWVAWKEKQIKTHNLQPEAIKLVNGNELIQLFKDKNLYNSVFKIEDSLLIAGSNSMLKDIHRKLINQESEQSKPEQAVLPGPIVIKDILFNNYTANVENFYFSREVDNKFIKNIAFGNIWVYGGSGVGKTALVNRNLIKNDFEFLYCDFGPVDMRTIDEFLNEIISSIQEKYGYNIESKPENKIKELCYLLGECSANRDVILVIDELSFPDQELEIEFAATIIKIISFYEKQIPSKKLKFVISTIPEPLKIIKDKGKASEHFQYLCANGWNNDLNGLLNMLLGSLGLKIGKPEFDAILNGCDNSPRLLKNIIKKIVLTDIVDEKSILDSIKKARYEYF